MRLPICSCHSLSSHLPKAVCLWNSRHRKSMAFSQFTLCYWARFVVALLPIFRLRRLRDSIRAKRVRLMGVHGSSSEDQFVPYECVSCHLCICCDYCRKVWMVHACLNYVDERTLHCLPMGLLVLVLPSSRGMRLAFCLCRRYWNDVLSMLSCVWGFDVSYLANCNRSLNVLDTVYSWHSCCGNARPSAQYYDAF